MVESSNADAGGEKRTRLLVLLGAGASYNYGPTTDWLTRSLLATDSGIEGEAVFRLVDETLKRKLTRTDAWGNRERFEPNFEQIIQAVDDIATHLPSKFGRSEFSPLLGPFISLSRSISALHPDREVYTRYASRAREFIVRATKRHCDQAASPRQHPCVLALNALSQRARIRLFSVNYDDLPAASGIDFYTGFVDNHGAAQVFRPVHPWPEDRHIWCQLHGSVLFRVRLRKTDVGRYPEIVRYAHRREVARRKWIDVDWGEFQDRHIAPVAPIITALRKADAMQREPYADYNHVFRSDALSCERWLIIGYGGGDHHINNLLSQARRYWRESGRNHRVLVVGKTPMDRRGFSLFGAMEQRPESGLGMEMWLFDEESYELDRWVRPRHVSQINASLGVSLDGVEWAMGDGLQSVMNFLKL